MIQNPMNFLKNLGVLTFFKLCDWFFAVIFLFQLPLVTVCHSARATLVEIIHPIPQSTFLIQ